MRAVLSSLVLLLGSAIALPSLLRTGQSNENVANDPTEEDVHRLHLFSFSPLCAFKRVFKCSNVANDAAECMACVELDEERFSNHPESKLSLQPLIQQALQALR